MRSALWAHTANAEASDACGAASGEKSLWFRGADRRLVDTAPLDVAHGGAVQFQLKMAPHEDAGGVPRCAVAYGSDVDLQYLVPSSGSGSGSAAAWTSLATFPTWEYRNVAFTQVGLSRPSGSR